MTTTTQTSLEAVYDATTKDELLVKLERYIEKFTGWEWVKVTYTHPHLNVDGSEGNLLMYDLSERYEVHGRVSHVGLAHTDFLLIKPLLTE